MDKKQHWENIYSSKQLNEVSWYEPTPKISLNFIREFHVPKDAKILDMGGGDSYFADNLLKLGYNDITVLDISSSALERAKQRLGKDSNLIKWVVADAANFDAPEKYDFWHDRAAFHFLTTENEIARYVKTASENINPNGIMIIGTFSEKGPTKCSGIEIQQYSEQTMNERFHKSFEKIKCFTIDHKTPFNTVQNFIFCSFRKK